MQQPSLYYTVRRHDVAPREIYAIVSRVLHALKAPRAIVSIHCIGDHRMRRLNREYRGRDQTTDVLSFPTRSGKHVGDGDDWGDIFLCLPQIRRQAHRFHVSMIEEFRRMLVHGILHVAGYDHHTKKEAQEMFALQERLVKK